MRMSDIRWPKPLPAFAVVIIGIWIALAFTRWSELVSGVRIGIPRVDNEFYQSLLFSGTTQGLAAAGTVLLHFCAAIIGYALVIRPVWGSRRLASEVWLVIAGIVPGTLMLIGLNRAIALFLPNSIAPYLAFFIIIIAAGLAAILLRKQWRADAVSVRWRDVIGPLIFLAGVSVLGIEFDRFHVVGEASSWFMDEVYLSDQFGIGHARFPLISQHYDEAALLYPVIYGLMHREPEIKVTFTTIYWIMIAFGRVGISALIYLSLRSLKIDRLSALIVLALVCTASLSLNVISSRLLFDSLSPLIFTLHTARFLIPVLPLIMASAFDALDEKFMLPTPAGLAISAALGLGLSSLPIHVCLVLLWSTLLIVITQIAPRAAASQTLWRSGAISALIILVTLMLVYSLPNVLGPIACVACLAGAGVIGGVLVLRSWLKTGITLNRRELFSGSVMVSAAMCVGYAVGLVCLGNIFIHKTDAVLGHVWPWAGLPFADRAVGSLVTSFGKLMMSPYCHGYSWGFRTLAGHCSSLPMLVRSYGLPFAAIAAILTWWACKTSVSLMQSDRQLSMIFYGLILCLLLLPLCFIYFDFVSPVDSAPDSARGLSVWLRSRLIEPWFYSGTLLTLVLSLRNITTGGRRWMQAAMLVAIGIGGLTPFVLPGQLIVNFSYLAGILLQ